MNKIRIIDAKDVFYDSDGPLLPRKARNVNNALSMSQTWYL